MQGDNRRDGRQKHGHQRAFPCSPADAVKVSGAQILAGEGHHGLPQSNDRQIDDQLYLEVGGKGSNRVLAERVDVVLRHDVRERDHQRLRTGRYADAQHLFQDRPVESRSAQMQGIGLVQFRQFPQNDHRRDTL